MKTYFTKIGDNGNFGLEAVLKMLKMNKNVRLKYEFTISNLVITKRPIVC